MFLQQAGVAALRSTLLTPDNRIQWGRLLELFEEASAAKEEAAEGGAEGGGSSSTEAAKAAAMNDAVGSLLGSPSGKTLRQVLRDLDSTDLMLRLVSPETHMLRHSVILAVQSRQG